MPIKKNIRHSLREQPACRICNEPVNLKDARCDEDGKAVHEDCYVEKVRFTKKPPPGSMRKTLN